MSNVAKALKAEISRISRKEAKSAVDPIAKSNSALRKIVGNQGWPSEPAGQNQGSPAFDKKNGGEGGKRETG